MSELIQLQSADVTLSSINWSLRRNATVTLQELLQLELVTLNECGEIVMFFAGET